MGYSLPISTVWQRFVTFDLSRSNSSTTTDQIDERESLRRPWNGFVESSLIAMQILYMCVYVERDRETSSRYPMVLYHLQIAMIIQNKTHVRWEISHSVVLVLLAKNSIIFTFFIKDHNKNSDQEVLVEVDERERGYPPNLKSLLHTAKKKLLVPGTRTFYQYFELFREKDLFEAASCFQKIT